MPVYPLDLTAYEQAADDKFPVTATTLAVVGHCPDCGCPIYGKPHVFVGERPPIVMSCRCSEDLTRELES